METNMIFGVQFPNFLKEKRISTSDYDLKTVMKHMYHCDTVERSYGWRVQGWIYVKDLPNTIPPLLQQGNCEVSIREGRPIVEIWAMALEDELPF